MYFFLLFVIGPFYDDFGVGRGGVVDFGGLVGGVTAYMSDEYARTTFDTWPGTTTNMRHAR